MLVIGEDRTAELWDPVTGQWHATASLNNPRSRFASVTLMDGRVLVAGGLNDIEQSYSSAYLFDPAAESWQKAAGLMITARTDPSAAVLPDGRVLVVGGYFHVAPQYGRRTGGTVLAAAHTSTSGAGTPPGGGLADIVPGPFGAALATTEVFDPATGQWRSTGPMQFARNGPAITPLADGRVLVAGDNGALGVQVDPAARTSAEIYDPAIGRFASVGDLPALDVTSLEEAGVQIGDAGAPAGGDLAALRDGGAVLIGQAVYWKHQGSATRSLRFDPASADWQVIGDTYMFATDHVGTTFVTPTTPRFNPSVAVLADGRVLVAGGSNNLAGDDAPGIPITLTSAEIYDPATDSWKTLPDMPEPRAGADSVLLSDGSVLLVGGVLQRSDFSVTSLRSAVLLTEIGD